MILHYSMYEKILAIESLIGFDVQIKSETRDNRVVVSYMYSSGRVVIADCEDSMCNALERYSSFSEFKTAYNLK